MILLDCTLRDGGYLNNWEFSPEFGKSLFASLSNTGIDIIELGFIYPEGSGGFFKTLTPEKVSYLVQDANEKANVCVMVDYGKCDYNLPHKSETEIDLVRVAVHKNNLYQAFELCKQIKSDGYKTSVQMMNFPSYTLEDIFEASKKAKEIDLDYLYIADSFGSMLPDNLISSLLIIKSSGVKVGFHPHNNLQMAFANSLKAIEFDVDILDGTLLGIGRGAGNLLLEQITAYLQINSNKIKYDLPCIFDLIENYEQEFNNCDKHLNCEYMISGLLNIHPTKIKEIRENGMSYSSIWKEFKTK